MLRSAYVLVLLGGPLALGCGDSNDSSDAADPGGLTIGANSTGTGTTGATSAGPGSTNGGVGGNGPTGTSGETTATSGGPAPMPGDIGGADAIVAPEAESPVALPEAPGFSEPVLYRPNRSSAMLYLPFVEGAQDYRVFALTDGVSVTSTDTGAEQVDGATIACAGLRQTNHCDSSEALSDFGGAFRVPNCSRDPRATEVTKEVLRLVELDGLVGPTTVVVEAIDTQCPFPGAFGNRSVQLQCVNGNNSVASGVYEGNAVEWRTCPSRFPIRTEEEIRADYGSLIINGHRPAAPELSDLPEGSPFAKIGLPASADPPTVLARSVVTLEPLGTETLPEGFTESDFFTDFSDESDQFERVQNAEILGRGWQVINPMLYQNSEVNLYTYGAENNGGSQAFITHDNLRMVLADWGQEIMGSNIVYPKRAFALPESADAYIHITFEIQTNASQRRYFWLHACGADTPGETVVDGQLAPESGIYPYPFFMDPDVPSSVSTAGWNCLQWVPRGGGYDEMSGGGGMGRSRPQTDIRVLINEASPDLTASGSQRVFTVLNVSPDMYNSGDAEYSGTWLRQWDANKRPVDVLLDNDMYIEQRTRFDVFFNRTRTVLYANGVQKICNDFESAPLTMAEAAVGLGHVLYHSAAEREEFLRDDWIRTGQYYYRHNTPFLDHRSIDNFGVRENAALPANFETGQCYAY